MLVGLRCVYSLQFQRGMLLDIFRSLIDIIQMQMGWLEPMQRECNATSSEDMFLAGGDFDILDHFKLTDFMTFSPNDDAMDKLDEEDSNVIPALTYLVNVSINFYSSEHEAATDLAVWQSGELKKINQTISPSKKFFRIGTVEVNKHLPGYLDLCQQLDTFLFCF